MKILIADDNNKVREFIKSLLASGSHEFHECKDGDETLPACMKFMPDLVLMDIKMKRMDGITAVKQLKKIFPGIKVIIITNYPYKDLKEESIKAGAARLLDKEELYRLPQILKEIKIFIKEGQS